MYISLSDDFHRKYGHDYRYVAKVEQMVWRHYKASLHDKCAMEREKQRRMIIKARQERKRTKREKAMKKALEYKLKACEEYERLPG